MPNSAQVDRDPLSPRYLGALRGVSTFVDAQHNRKKTWRHFLGTFWQKSNEMVENTR